jgi:hypothetical protein
MTWIGFRLTIKNNSVWMDARSGQKNANQIEQSINTILSQQPKLNLIKIADGAADNWRFLSDTLFRGQGLELLDYFHASDPLNDAME